ncbi:MAG: ABC transporter ATP-binding protein [Chloroflexi bacterium]|nr:ABC transporter ATP-binding protein [Chloroflexota bacterium]MCI0578967.1 ABC transporter ATP-binding protein [Chloroflexota bacterium]MCI0645095.1 ABC transporter ATP-binding protein [Chloroflexota bacterium]MCI0731930.1 ABC transporter ATP-binding protein [Chloroflexota bacterium]
MIDTQKATKDVQLNAPTRENMVLKVRDLRVHYATPLGDVIAVNGISFDVYPGELVGLVGESGCGKTTAAMALLRLVQPPGRIVHGQVIIDGTDLVTLSNNELRRVRWRELALIPQGAMNSLNPVIRIKDQIADGIETHEGEQPKSALKERILKLLNMVGLPGRVYNMYPHELSGGMKQRVCIAMAIALNPPLIIADEPTSALDVIVQRVVAQTLLDVKKRLGVSMIVIGHDMGLLAQLVDRIAVMYAGNIVEIAPVKEIFAEPLHPYTQLLISSIPSIKERKPLVVTEGLTHDLRNPPPGCIFQLRCPHVMDVCRQVTPPLRELKPKHFVACHLYE